MQINLSDETLDHLRYHLGRYRDATKKLGDKAKRKGDIARYQLHLDQLNDLIAIFTEAEPPQHFDVTATNQGTVFHFALHTDASLDFVPTHFNLEPWQWLGKKAFAIDHRFAPQVVCLFRDNGFTVEVR